MKQLFFITLIFWSCLANADFAVGLATGMVLGSSGNSDNCEQLAIDMRTPTFYCNANSDRTDCINEKASIQIKKKGYEYFKRREVVYYKRKVYIVYDVYKNKELVE